MTSRTHALDGEDQCGGSGHCTGASTNRPHTLKPVQTVLMHGRATSSGHTHSQTEPMMVRDGLHRHRLQWGGQTSEVKGSVSNTRVYVP